MLNCLLISSEQLIRKERACVQNLSTDYCTYRWNKALSGAGAISVNKYKHVEMNISGTTNCTAQSSLAGGTSSSSTPVVHDQMDQKMGGVEGTMSPADWVVGIVKNDLMGNRTNLVKWCNRSTWTVACRILLHPATKLHLEPNHREVHAASCGITI